MLSHFETRLADVLGSRLTAPFAGRVFVAPGPADTARPALLVGVRRADVIAENFGGSRRPEQVPGAADPRRVVRLSCELRIEVRSADGASRADTMAALDALLYELDSPDLRSAAALSAPGDPGFALARQLPEAVVVRSDDPAVPDSTLPAVLLHADGWFWPPNTPGEVGVPIVAAQIRTSSLPVTLDPWPLVLRAGDPAVPLRIRVRAVGTTVLTGGAPTRQPFGDLAVRVVDAGGRPGAGTLTGGDAGPDGCRFLPMTTDTATLSYQPPAAAATDTLVVAIARPDTGGGRGFGEELARFPLVVRA